MADTDVAAAAAALPGVSRRAVVATATFPRYSEGDVAEPADGRLLLAVGRKAGADDLAVASIVGALSAVGRVSGDGAVHVIRAPWGDGVDVMSASFGRAGRGVHIFFLGRGREATQDTRVYQMISADEGRTWGEPALVSTRGGYHVV